MAQKIKARSNNNNLPPFILEDGRNQRSYAKHYQKSSSQKRVY